jgi:glutathione synthase/RimK-type ligase-like ATP-grasp enzyme
MSLIAAAARHEWFTRWWNLTSARVVNRPAAMLSNCSKPWQLQIIRDLGFSIPATLISCDPGAVREFQRRFGRLIYKSISSVRSIVRELTPGDDERLKRIRWCPTQFQEFIPGRNVRVHVVAEKCFATEIASESVDYRYALSEVGVPAELRPTELPPEIARRCVALTRHLGLAFGGLDLKVSPNGRVVCFEVNPSPGFSYYEDHTGQPIAAAVADYLVRGSEQPPANEHSEHEPLAWPTFTSNALAPSSSNAAINGANKNSKIPKKPRNHGEGRVRERGSR